MTTFDTPRGIRLVQWTNKDKTTSVRYRVSIKRKDFVRDEIFKELDEAKQFLAMSKTHGGKAILEKQKASTAQLEQEIYRKAVEDFAFTTHLKDIFRVFKEDFIDNLEISTHEQKRKKTSLLSFLKALENTEILHTTEAYAPAFITRKNKIKFSYLGSIALKEFSEYDVNEYIKARLKKGRKSATINKELIVLSQIFEHCRATSKALKGIVNPVSLRDKRLLNNLKDTKPKRRLSDDDFKKLYEAIEKYSNKEMSLICRLALTTAMRRSEIINLTWSEVKTNYIELTKTKTNPRDVFITNEAREILDSIPRTGERVFTSYKNTSSFEGSFKKLMARSGLSHISFHIFRKEAISTFYEQLGAENSTMLSQFLGVRSLKKFRQLHEPKENFTLKTEQGLLKIVGHESAQTSIDHYLTLKK